MIFFDNCKDIFILFIELIIDSYFLVDMVLVLSFLFLLFVIIKIWQLLQYQVELILIVLKGLFLLSIFCFVLVNLVIQ